MLRPSRPLVRLCTLVLLAAAAAALAVSTHHASGARAATIGSSLSRPQLSNPVVIQLHVGSDSLHLNDSRDYILKMPSQKKTGPLYVKGGRNILIVGGYMSTKTKGPNINIHDGDNAQSGRIIHIERLLIDGSSKVPSDGIQIHAPKAIVQLKLDRFVGFWGTLSGYHADVVQPAGGVKELRIDGLTGSSHYNDFYLRRENNPLMPAIGKVTIRNTNMFGYTNSTIPHQTIRGIAIGTQGSPPSDDSLKINCAVTSPMILDNFWITPPQGRPTGQFVWPHIRMADPASWCDARYNSSTHTMNWPNLSSSKGGPVHGAAHVGAHSDFVPSGAAGLSYR